MKILIFIFTFLFCSFSSVSSGQLCLPDRINLNSQVDIDNFASNYPNCTEIEGDLYIGGFFNQKNTDIINLNGLNQIVSVKGDLIIWHMINLTALTGLENLTSVGGGLGISGNPALSNLSGIRNIESTGDFLDIRNNQALTSLDGLSNLATVGSYFVVHANHALNSLEGMENLSIVEGALQVFYNDILVSLKGLENLSYLGGSLLIHDNSSLTSLEGLEQLDSIGAGIQIRTNSFLKSLDGLEALEYVKGDIDIHGNASLLSLSGLWNLKNTIYDINIYDNAQLESLTGLRNLKSIKGFLNIHDNPSLTSLRGLDSLSSVGDLIVHRNPTLASLEGLNNLKSSTSISINGNPELESLEGLNELRFATRDIRIENNPSLTSLQGLNNLGYTRRDFVIIRNSALVSLTGIENLRFVSRHLSINENDVLPSLTGLEKLSSVGGSLGFSSNDSLTSLVGLENLIYIGNSLGIHRNNNLTSLTGLGRIDYNELDKVTILNNPLLSVCNEYSICSYLANGGNHDISGNASGCYNSIEIIESCDNLSKVNYQLFHDFNQDKKRTGNEPIHPDATILLNPQGSFHYSEGNKGGFLFLNEGSYAISYNEGLLTAFWELTTDSTTYHINVDSTYSCDTLYFGIFPKEEVPLMNSSVNAPPARCNEFIPFDLHTKNRGTTVVNGTLWLKVDERIEEVQFVDPPDNTIAPYLYGWHFYNLYPGHSVSKQILVQIPGPPDFSLGDQLQFISYSDFYDLNDQYQSQSFVYNTEVRCSYDPNDKLVNPGRENKETLFEEELIYTIRFQNTGNDVAYDVVVLDTLDDNLDASTFEILSSSHPKRLLASMEANRYLTFNFKDIFLPDSTTNLEGSQGYISYVINPIDGLPEKTVIRNTASIYFDSNPPIVTNTTENVLVSELTVQEGEENIKLRISPNPTNGQFYIQGSASFDGELLITDYIGRRILQRAIRNSQEVDLSQQSSGVYFITIQTKKGKVTEKVIKF